ncbi:MAG: hypothetical protein ACLFSN_03105 [Candidatus Woesearchaeota archaeon]
MPENANYQSDVTGQGYSREQFLKMAEKRLKKHLRQTGELDVKTAYRLEAEAEGDAKLLETLLARIFDGRIDVSRKTAAKDGRDILYARPLETHVTKNLGYFLENGAVDVLKKQDINPLRIFTVHECKVLADILGIEEPVSPLSNRIIEEMHENYSQTKPSLLKSIDELKKQLKQAKDFRQ